VHTYNKESFLKWRAEADPQAYEQAMSTFFQGWGPELEAQIAAWLNEKR
jgi:hypothetical protein